MSDDMSFFRELWKRPAIKAAVIIGALAETTAMIKYFRGGAKTDPTAAAPRARSFFLTGETLRYIPLNWSLLAYTSVLEFVVLPNVEKFNALHGFSTQFICNFEILSLILIAFDAFMT